MKLGRVVVTVAEFADRKEAICTSVMFVVIFCKGYKPINGGSFPLIPKLIQNQWLNFINKQAKKYLKTE